MGTSTQDISACLRNTQCLTGRIRLRVVRDVVDQVREVIHRPTKKQFGAIDESVVYMYPKSLRDKMKNVVVGTGYDSLGMQFVNRNDNLNSRPVKGTRQVQTRIKVKEVQLRILQRMHMGVVTGHLLKQI